MHVCVSSCACARPQVHMKTLTLLQTLLSKGSMCCQLACKRSLLATVEDIEMSFFDIDPEVTLLLLLLLLLLFAAAPPPTALLLLAMMITIMLPTSLDPVAAMPSSAGQSKGCMRWPF